MVSVDTIAKHVTYTESDKGNYRADNYQRWVCWAGSKAWLRRSMIGRSAALEHGVW